MHTKEILTQLISFDTTSRNPNDALIKHVAELLSDNGIQSTLIPDDTGKKANLYATVGPQDTPGIMLSGHTDVVPIDGQDWTKPAFELTEENNRYYGRGTTDMKGFVASAIRIAIEASKRDLKTPLHLGFSYDEEIGCVGVRSMIEMLDKAPIKPGMCIVGEPTEMQVATGHKGKTGLKAVFTGREGHSALAPKAVNALYMATDFITALRNIQEELRLNGLTDDDYDVPYTTLHVGKLNGGVALNIVPNSCEMLFEIRNIAEDAPGKIVDKLRQQADIIITEAQEIAPEADISIEIINTYPGMNTPKQSEVVEFVKSLTGGNSTCKMAFGTEGGLFSQELGIPTVICGPGSMAQGHKPDEYVAIEQIEKCDLMLDTLLNRLEAGIPLT